MKVLRARVYEQARQRTQLERRSARNEQVSLSLLNSNNNNNQLDN